MKLALYGGSFDPPHAGHINVVREALHTLAVDKLIIVPAARNPFKSSVYASGDIRHQWLKHIFGSIPKVEISDFEISQDQSIPTIETVLHYLPMCDTLYLIIGADNLVKLEQWHRFNELTKLVHWVVASRGDIPIPESMIRLDVDCPISSTDFRYRFSPLGLDPHLENEIITYYKELNESKN